MKCGFRRKNLLLANIVHAEISFKFNHCTISSGEQHFSTVLNARACVLRAAIKKRRAGNVRTKNLFIVGRREDENIVVESEWRLRDLMISIGHLTRIRQSRVFCALAFISMETLVRVGDSASGYICGGSLTCTHLYRHTYMAGWTKSSQLCRGLGIRKQQTA